MLTVYIAVGMLLVVAATGAPLARLADLRIRRAWLLWAALLDQVVVISVLPDSHPTALALAHVASYVAAGLCLLANRRMPGIWSLGGGGALNGFVISLNGGTLPASDQAVRASGQDPRAEHFNNSAVLDHPRLPWLGDVFATPAWLPGHNVFSVGDIAIWAGLAWLLWRTCRPGVTIARHRAPVRGRHTAARTMSRA
jgi:hypothetical protein